MNQKIKWQATYIIDIKWLWNNLSVVRDVEKPNNFKYAHQWVFPYNIWRPAYREKSEEEGWSSILAGDDRAANIVPSRAELSENQTFRWVEASKKYQCLLQAVFNENGVKIITNCWEAQREILFAIIKISNGRIGAIWILKLRIRKKS